MLGWRPRFSFSGGNAIAFEYSSFKDENSFFVKPLMGLVRLKIREMAAEKGWTLKEVSQRSEIPYTTITTYARSQGMSTVDATALLKLAQVFDVAIEDLLEVVEQSSSILPPSSYFPRSLPRAAETPGEWGESSNSTSEDEDLP